MKEIDQIIFLVKINQKDWIGIGSGELLEENLNKIFLLRVLVEIVRRGRRKRKFWLLKRSLNQSKDFESRVFNQ